MLHNIHIGACALFLATSITAGCGTVYVNEQDRDLGAAERSEVTLESSVDAAYRRVFGRLESCLSTYGYRVRGSINRQRDAANVVVDSGIGFDRVLYLADSVFLRAELARLAPERTRVTFVLPTADARPFADAASRWLVAGEGPCRV
ncbi:MAG: hypothetical protein R3174_04710 [Gammaproteobacteria bacterium]|nr:hypothetical protein [Gammaproteobacteria bacterium]